MRDAPCLPRSLCAHGSARCSGRRSRAGGDYHTAVLPHSQGTTSATPPCPPFRPCPPVVAASTCLLPAPPRVSRSAHARAWPRRRLCGHVKPLLGTAAGCGLRACLGCGLRACSNQRANSSTARGLHVRQQRSQNGRPGVLTPPDDDAGVVVCHHAATGTGKRTVGMTSSRRRCTRPPRSSLRSTARAR